MTVSRVVDKLLHAPTVRVKQLAGGPGGDSYAAALRELFGSIPTRRRRYRSSTRTARVTASGSGSGGRAAPLRLGTRRSEALSQARNVADAIVEQTGAQVELVEIVTQGDRSAVAVAQLGGTGVFVSALRDELRAQRIDLAVHSLKDLPTAPDDDVVLAAVPARATRGTPCAARRGGPSESSARNSRRHRVAAARRTATRARSGTHVVTCVATWTRDCVKSRLAR